MTPEQYSETPLGESLAELSREIALAGQDGFSVILDLEDARRLARAAALLRVIYDELDRADDMDCSGQLFVKIEDCILGKEDRDGDL